MMRGLRNSTGAISLMTKGAASKQQRPPPSLEVQLCFRFENERHR